MTSKDQEPRRPVKPLDPNSERGKQAAHNAGVIAAGVIARLRREGRPIPPARTRSVADPNPS